MKIERVHPVVLKATRGYAEWVIVRVRTNQGIEGIGEGFTWSGQAAAICSHVDTINRQISGTSPMGIEAFLKRFIAQARDRNWYAAISAVEIALWDIVGKIAELPIHALLGGPLHNEIPLYADHGLFDGAECWEEQVERILAAKQAGFAMFKWDPFVGTGTPDPKELSKQIDRVRRVREAVGNDYPLAIDAHNRFSVEGAIMAAKALEPLDQEYAGGAPRNEWENELLDPPTQIENGHIILPDGPGLGSGLNEKLLASRRMN